MIKHHGKAYIAETKTCDDTHSDEDEEYGNFALMADSSKNYPQSSQMPILTSIDMSLFRYENNIKERSLEIFNIYTSMLNVDKKMLYKLLNSKILNLNKNNYNLLLLELMILSKRMSIQRIRSLVLMKLEKALEHKLFELKGNLNVYKNSGNKAKEIVHKHSPD